MKKSAAAALAAVAALIVFGPFGPAPSRAQAQARFPACESQQALEQVLQSNGALTPDDCRMVVVTPVESEGRRLCLVDFSGSDDGFLQGLRDAALPEKWWIRCDRLEAGG